MILNTAQRLFEQYGVEQVSMNQIASEAQIGPGTLYRRYRNKGELCLDLIKDSIDLFFEDIEEYLNENHTVPPQQRLKEILSFFIRFRGKKAQLLTGVEETNKPWERFLWSELTSLKTMRTVPVEFLWSFPEKYIQIDIKNRFPTVFGNPFFERFLFYNYCFMVTETDPKIRIFIRVHEFFLLNLTYVKQK
ncbi:TetR/AcrR family transcriptional regulator [Bacillus sp. AFS031507]|uniref:TetR/AcrR family transcriptional regulator n=1 Tax=Bacillus sp. AFS031507 TaxID=2033496 RepID=UPI000BFD0364|nr:TetR/AcrR family transcriptional regulator [Bacillus sp. AFS031507]PGY09100.1 hypothetical protein COE25_18695 [Bacillus sp. AFS031507]